MRPRPTVWLGLVLSGCAVEAPEPGPLRLEVEGARVEAAAGVHLMAANATLTPDGRGEGADVQVALEGPPSLEVRSDRSDWDLAARVVRFQGSVVATRGPVALRCDALEVTYASADRVAEAIALGNVRVERDGRLATGARAHLQAETGRVELTGEAVLSEGPNRMSGERIVLWLDQERVECERCRLVVAGDAIAPIVP